MTRDDGDYPTLGCTVLDTPDPRALAEFYRLLLGFSYRPGDELAPGEDDLEWLVLRDETDTPRLAFQLSLDLPRPQWPTGSPPQMLHLDLHVGDTAALERQRKRAEALGATVLRDRSDDAEEPLYVFADPNGHPFCIFV